MSDGMNLWQHTLLPLCRQKMHTSPKLASRDFMKVGILKHQLSKNFEENIQGGSPLSM